MAPVIWYGNPCSEEIRDYMSAGKIGCIITPDQGNVTFPDEWDVIADNGCYISPKAWAAGKRWDEAKWRRFILDIPRTVRFAVAPDVFYPDGRPCHDETLEQWRTFGPHLERHGFTPAFVCQVGATVDNVPDAPVMFLGGTTAWKLGRESWDITKKAKEEGRWVHMGRLNSNLRFDLARVHGGIGCDSSDGTILTFGPDKNIQRVREWIQRAEANPMLWEATT